VLFVVFVPRGLVSLPRTVLDHPTVQSWRRDPGTVTDGEAEHE
jgi:branched-chain amino acid transport system permease protein